MRTTVLNCPVDILTLDETINAATTAMRERQPVQHVALNVAKLVSARSNEELDRDVRQADIIGIDGAGIALALKLAGHGNVPRVTGVDLFDHLMTACAAQGFRPYLLGATEEVLSEACRRIEARHPTLQIAGRQNGYFKGREREIVDAIKAAKPDCLFLAMPTPMKERFMAAYRTEMNVPFVMGIGGTLDVAAGLVQRAPIAWQKSGFEWLYRLLQEPRRMWKRYLTTNTIFAGLLVKDMIARTLARSRSNLPNVGGKPAPRG
ncbi:MULTISPECIES: WecB/TagA/CpsF family glycosyltransferase [unclassified Beijerinckia]|uniref:WecB/TagA/CpsF family glycosyltransferase n=1 Tax=unclassified Beijerinckia TaxID=2638183 RepID=UPI00089B005F|nr:MULTISPECIES: WecB/TagA/CpsF family glycosyltransferase [unclassified Beijerinckia]MDH7794166.1 N-acetylglucosaminyldiphosphoundecaprenol N-acetyl-beta-D-mannosaminyltransferase [Beijerinckia sp. GAS462]SEB54786.1 N-acetylglucosaminyldiphosphoundecaprenol N-acetyl-beta-D-mannosaminyltransferase [Beijerinckia sp. 28-YEA-48]